MSCRALLERLGATRAWFEHPRMPDECDVCGGRLEGAYAPDVQKTPDGGHRLTAPKVQPRETSIPRAVCVHCGAVYEAAVRRVKRINAHGRPYLERVTRAYLRSVRITDYDGLRFTVIIAGEL